MPIHPPASCPRARRESTREQHGGRRGHTSYLHSTMDGTPRPRGCPRACHPAAAAPLLVLVSYLCISAITVDDPVHDMEMEELG